MSYRNATYCTTGALPSFLLFFRVLRDKWPSVPSTVDGSRHDNTVKRNRASEEKLKTYANAKRRAKPTELKAGDDVFIKHTIKKDKLASYWASDLFTIAKVHGSAIIVKRKRDGKVFARKYLLAVLQK